MEKQWKYPFWENYQKDRITAKLIINHADGKETSSTATVAKYDGQGNLNKDFQDIIDQNTLAVIDRNTKDREDRHKEQKNAEKKARDERIQSQKLEALFNAKLEVFEIDFIKNSKNRKLKAMIRKAKNHAEMMAFATILIKEEYDAQQSTVETAE